MRGLLKPHPSCLCFTRDLHQLYQHMSTLGRHNLLSFPSYCERGIGQQEQPKGEINSFFLQINIASEFLWRNFQLQSSLHCEAFIALSIPSTLPQLNQYPWLKCFESHFITLPVYSSSSLIGVMTETLASIARINMSSQCALAPPTRAVLLTQPIKTTRENCCLLLYCLPHTLPILIGWVAIL